MEINLPDIKPSGGDVIVTSSAVVGVTDDVGNTYVCISVTKHGKTWQVQQPTIQPSVITLTEAS
jgi:hypothetical protein